MPERESFRSVKGVILVGGPSRGTRFRPLSMNIAKPLFPIGGVPMIQHPIEALARLPNLTEILLIGFYEQNLFTSFIEQMKAELNVNVR